VVTPSEGNEVRREGRWEVGTPHSTVEPGRLGPRAPWGGKGASEQGIVGGKHGQCIETGNCVDATTTNSRVGEAVTADGVHLPGLRSMAWDRFALVLQTYPLLPPRVVHSVYRS
jgi:hypothetical protein